MATMMKALMLVAGLRGPATSSKGKRDKRDKREIEKGVLFLLLFCKALSNIYSLLQKEPSLTTITESLTTS